MGGSKPEPALRPRKGFDRLDGGNLGLYAGLLGVSAVTEINSSDLRNPLNVTDKMGVGT